MSAPKLSLILPCYNSADILREHFSELTKQISESSIECEYIVVDDGSTRGPSLSNMANQFGFQLAVHEKNKGKGAAIRTGMQRATGDVLVFTDCDIPFGYESVVAMYQVLANRSADIAIVHRKMSGYDHSGSMMRNVGSRFFGVAVKLILQRDLGDTQCGLKGFTKATARSIFETARLDGFSADVEWLVLGAIKGYRVAKVPATLRHTGKSSVSLLRHTLPMLRDVLLVRWWIFSGAYQTPKKKELKSNSEGQ